MRTKLLAIGAAATTIIAAAPISPVFAGGVESTYPTNAKGDLMVTKIKPHTSELELTLNRLSENTYYPVYTYFWNGRISDEMMRDIPGMGEEFEYVKVLYHGLVNGYYPGGGEMTEDGSSVTLDNSVMWNRYDFMEFEEPILGYFILYGNSAPGLELDRPSYKGWIDYNRCVNSLAFKSGEATECWAEDLGDGTVQYQPYDEFGNRYEVVFEEEIGEDDGGNGDAGNDGDVVNDEDGDDENGEQLVVPGEIDGGENDDEDGAPDDEDGSAGVGDGISGGDGDDAGEIEIRELPEVKEKIVYVTQYRDRYVGGRDGVVKSVAPVFGGMAANSLNAESSDEKGGESDENNRKEEVTKEEKEEIEVPNLGKQMEKKSDWQMYATIILIMAACLSGLWFIFFGKKSKKEEEKE